MKLIANDVSVWTAVEPVFLMEQFVYFSFKMVDFEMSGFEPQASWIGNNCNVPLATTTALNITKFVYISKCLCSRFFLTYFRSHRVELWAKKPEKVIENVPITA